MAGATQDKTPRVGIVLSSYSGSEDHDGTKLTGLAQPRPPGSSLTPAQVDAMLRKALEIGQPRTGGIESIIRADDWVMVLCGEGADREVVRALVNLLASSRLGGRITVAGKGLADLTRKAPGVRVETLEMAREQTVEAPVPEGEKVYAVSKTLQQCDRVISVAALAGEMTFGAFLATAPKAPHTAEALVDVFSFHPADYAVLTSRDLVVAGANAVAVDTVGAAMLGRDPAKVDYLVQAVRRGLGINDPDAIWTRGNEIEEVRKTLTRTTAAGG